MTKIINHETEEVIIEDENLSMEELVIKAVKDDIYLGYADLYTLYFNKDTLLYEDKGVDLQDVNLEGTSFYDALLYGANFRGANLRKASFWKTGLSGANFFKADLYKANFEDANLRDTDFRGANIRGANFEGADIKGIKINKDQVNDLLKALGVKII